MTHQRSLNALDRTMLAGESRETMIHVGSLLTFSPPADGAKDFHRQLLEELKRAHKVYPPYNLKLRQPEWLGSPRQAWVEDTSFDLEYHLRRSALPTPCDERELGILVSRLHSNPIDFHRPPWEAHFIENIEGNRFAMYFKVHHALIDGFTGMRLLTRSMSTDPNERDTPMFFSREPPDRATFDDDDQPPALETLLRLFREQVSTTKDVWRALKNVATATRSGDRDLVAPMQAPHCILNRAISRNRRFATQQHKFERVKAVADAAGGTVNDAILAICGSSLRRFLLEQNALPSESLTAMVPVNVRPKDDPGGGNAVGAILATFATDLDNPKERIYAVIASTKRAKEQLQGMSRNAIMQYGALLMTPLILSLLPSAVERIRPAFNVVVSNVPGPEHPLYFRGFRLEANFPLSIPLHGYALNITVAGYAKTLNFGFTGCRDAIPHLQRLAVYTREALEELESAFQLR